MFEGFTRTIEEIVENFESVPMIIFSGLCLLASFLMPESTFENFTDPAWFAVIVCGSPIVFSALKRLIKNSGVSKISSPLLISCAMFAAIGIGDLFAAGEVAFIMSLGELLEDKTTARAKKGLHKLINLAPQTGRVIKKNSEKILPVEKISVGDIVRVLPGETFPIDGVIISGETSADQSVLTGESLPVDKNPGDEIFCGTINRFGAVDIRTTKIGAENSLQKLIRMVKEAESNRAPMQRIADKCASYLVPVALLIAVVTYFATSDVVRAVTVLVVFCPCALVLATPTAIMAAIGQATKHGVIIKSGAALEAMGKAKIIAFDKTGTLTHGKLKVSDVISFDEKISEDELLKIVSGAESKSEHPIGKAVVQFAKEKNISPAKISNFKMTAGRGIFSTIGRKKIFCGNENFLEENEIFPGDEVKERLNFFGAQGKASILVADEEKCFGIIALSDTLRANAKNIVQSLVELKIKPVLLTGDNKPAAEYLAERVGISEVNSKLLPEDKVEKIISLQKENNVVCMVGDGVNDAPALKSADVGIAPGKIGSDIAIEAADIALMNDDISKIPYLKRLADATAKTIVFGISLSMLINIVAVILSVQGILNPVTGALVHNLGSCLVILIAALLYDRNFEDEIPEESFPAYELSTK